MDTEVQAEMAKITSPSNSVSFQRLNVNMKRRAEDQKVTMIYINVGTIVCLGPLAFYRD